MKIFYQRHLPHFQPSGYTYFVTFRLANSLPVTVIRELIVERELILNKIAGIMDDKERANQYYSSQSQYFEKFDSLLDSHSTKANWLARDDVARIVYNAIKFFDAKKYDLIASTIMPNHVHIVFSPIDESDTNDKKGSTESTADDSNFIVTKVLRDLKKYSARECNNVLGRSGNFWQHESYDHVVRNESELKRIIEYTLHNPVKAGLCETIEDWKWNYAKHLIC